MTHSKSRDDRSTQTDGPMSFRQETGLTEYLRPTDEPVCGIPSNLVCDFPVYPEEDPPACRPVTPFVGASGSSYPVCAQRKVILILWGRTIELTFEEFEAQASEFRRRLIGEGAVLEDSLRSTYDIYHELYSEHYWTNLVSRGVSLPDINWLKATADRVRSLTNELRGGSIDPHRLYAVGLRFRQVRDEEKEKIRQLQGKTNAAIDRAETIQTGLTVTEDVSFEILKIGNQIYALNNPVRKAAGEIAIVVLRGGAASLGNYLAFKDRRHVLKGLHAVLVRDVPPILKGLMCGSLQKAFASAGAGGLVEDAVEIFLRAQINLLFEILNEALKEKPKFDDLWVLEICTVTLENALVELVGRLLFGKKKADSWNAKLIAFNVLGKAVVALTPEIVAAKREATKEKKSFVDVFLGRLPNLIITLFKVILLELVETAMKKRWPEDVARREWDTAKDKVRAEVKKLASALGQKETEEPNAKTTNVKPVDGSGGVIIDMEEARKRLRKDDKKGSSHPQPEPKPAAPKVSEPKENFAAIGFEEKDIPPPVLRLLRAEVARDLNRTKSSKAADDIVRSYVNSSDQFFDEYHPKPEWKLYKLVPKGAGAPRNSGWYLSEAQLNAIRQRPDLLHNIYAALPDVSISKALHSSATAEYDVYVVTPKEGAIAFRSGVAPVASSYRDEHGNVQHKLIKLGGSLGSVPDGKGGRIKIETEQIIIANGEQYSEARSLGETVTVPPEKYRVFAKEAME